MIRYSLIELLSKDTLLSKSMLFRKICVRIFPEMGCYPEVMNVEGIKISWRTLYEDVIIYADTHTKFDKYDFYVEGIQDHNTGSNIITLILWNYLQAPEKEILFTGTLLMREKYNLSSYHSTYFEDLFDSIITKRCALLKEKIKTMELLKSNYEHGLMRDIEGNKIAVYLSPNTELDLTSPDQYPEIVLIYSKDSKRPSLSEVYRKGYDTLRIDYAVSTLFT